MKKERRKISFNLNREKITDFFKKDFNGKTIRNGSYSMVITAVVIVAVIILNLIVGELPAKYTQIDASEGKIYTIGEETQKLAESLDKDVTLYLIAQSGSEDDVIQKMLQRYEDLSDHITVEVKDPVLYPSFTSNYTDDEVAENSVIVVCGDKSRVVDYSSMYETSMDYYSYSSTVTGYDGEGQVTSAISYVTSDDNPIVYTLEGHGEASISSSLTELVEKSNIETESLNLLTEEGVPEDADCLMIASPTKDISADEAEKIIAYLEAGGKALILTDYTAGDMPNLNSVLNAYGVNKESSVVFEGDMQHYISMTPYYILPETESHEITSPLSQNYILMPIAQPITELEDARDTLSITPILTTTDDAYAKLNVESMETLEKEDEDTAGPFKVGVVIEEDIETEDGGSDSEESTDESADTEESTDEDADSTDESADAEESTDKDADSEESTDKDADSEDGTDEDADEEEKTTKIVYYSSGSLLTDSIDQMVTGSNSQLISNSLNWLCSTSEDTSAASIPSKSLEVEYLTYTAYDASFWSIIVIGIVPCAFLIVGFCIWMKRRKQ